MLISIRYIILISLLFLIIPNVNAQKITLNISGYEGSSKLYSLEGEKTFLIDSIDSDNGKIRLISDKYDFHNGFYRFIISKDNWVDFIYDGEDVELTSNIKNISDSLVVLNSNSNKLLHQFKRLNKVYKTKTELLQLVLARYPKDDDYYNATQNKLAQLQIEYHNFVNITSQTEPKSFIARYIKSAQLPILRMDIIPENQISYFQASALNNINFDDAELIYSDLFTNKSIEYLMYYRNPQLPKELLEKEFMKATDSLFNKAKVNELVYQHITEYLISGFKQFGFDNIIDYIIRNYVVEDDLCLDEKLEHSIQRRLEQSKQLAIGKSVPNFQIPDSNGNIINLENIKAEKTLIVFYASWCPHCKTILPEINMLYNNQTDMNFEVIAISLDEDKKEWLNFVKDNKLNFMNGSDGRGWSGKVSSDYFIYATPTMFLLNSEKIIIAKPLKIKKLKEYLQ